MRKGTGEKVGFENNNPAFTVQLRKSVQEYFSNKNIRHTGNARLYVKSAIIMAIAVGSYVLLILNILPVWISVLLCVLLGASLAAIGFNMMHEGAHGSYSSKKWVNEIMALSLNIMGGNSYIWKLKHNINHHTFTNIDGLDDDIDIKPWIRTNQEQDLKWYHRYQHVYWIVLYFFTYLIWVFNKDFKKYFSKRIADKTEIKNIPLKEHLIFWGSKVVYAYLFVALPVITLGVMKALIGYLIISFSCGLVISIVFQMAHVLEDTKFPKENKLSNYIENEWTVHQLETTANFSTRNKFTTWFAGGLNFQVEHHLFPKISHIHYPEVNKIVKRVCKQYNVLYIEHPNLWSALRSHVNYLKAMGRAA